MAFLKYQPAASFLSREQYSLFESDPIKCFVYLLFNSRVDLAVFTHTVSWWILEICLHSLCGEEGCGGSPFKTSSSQSTAASLDFEEFCLKWWHFCGFLHVAMSFSLPHWWERMVLPCCDTHFLVAFGNCPGPVVYTTEVFSINL